jgi:hypothetical protein
MAAEENDGDVGGARELWRLSIEERHLSALRRQLHERMDSGSAGIGAEERERWISAARRDLHAAIDERGGRFERQ